MGSEDPALSSSSSPDGVAHRCRLFYERRLKQAEGLRETFADATPTAAVTAPTPTTPPSTTTATTMPVNTRLKEAMHQLRQQIANLIVEDNALFRQLLTLNDSIEELKEQHHRCLLEGSRCSSLESLSDPDAADESASPTSTLSSSSSVASSTAVGGGGIVGGGGGGSGGVGNGARPRFFRPVYPTTPPVRRCSSSTLTLRHATTREGSSSRPLHIVTKDVNGRLVLLRPCSAAGAFHLTRVDANCPYDSGFHGSESDAENNEIFV